MQKCVLLILLRQSLFFIKTLSVKVRNSKITIELKSLNFAIEDKWVKRGGFLVNIFEPIRP